MEQTQGSGGETANGTGKGGKADKVDSALETLHKGWLERTGGKMPDKKAIDAVKAKLQKAYDAEQEAVTAQEAARKDFEKASEEALELLGRKNVSLKGNVLLTPSSRDGRVYYKKMTHEDAV